MDTSPDLSQVLADARGEICQVTTRSIPARVSVNASVRAGGSGQLAPDLARAWPVSGSSPKAARILAPMTCALYYLADPRTPRHPRYVGITSNPAERERRHRSWNSTTWEFRAWKEDLHAAGLAPKLIVIEWFSDREAAAKAEWRLMYRWMRRGLCDCNSGAEGGTERFALYCAGMRRSRVA